MHDFRQKSGVLSDLSRHYFGINCKTSDPEIQMMFLTSKKERKSVCLFFWVICLHVWYGYIEIMLKAATAIALFERAHTHTYAVSDDDHNACW